MTVRFTAPDAGDLDLARLVAGVTSVARDGDRFTVSGTGPLLARVAHALVERGIEPADLHADLPTLEDAYLTLTGVAPEAAGPTAEAG